MAKQRKLKPEPPSSLTMSLHAPGMTILHRAGLGGLACSLKYIERAYTQGAILDDELPGDWSKGKPPWEMSSHAITLHFGGPEKAEGFLKRLFAIAFQVRDGLIYLPGQYSLTPPSIGIRAAIQDGLLHTFYDHGPQSRGTDSAATFTVEVDGQTATFTSLSISWYKHQRDGAEMAHESLIENQPISRTIFPGAIQRHATSKASSIEEPAERLIPLLFGPIGTLCLRAGGKRVKDRGKTRFKPGAVIVIPEFTSVDQAMEVIPAILPRSVVEARIQSTGDAVLGAELRVRSRLATDVFGVVGFRAVWCCPTDWNSRLQPPSHILEVSADALDDLQLQSYEIARAELPPRVRSRNVVEKTGRGKNKTQVERTEWFWRDSLICPRITNNLASGQPWYSGFRQFFVEDDPRDNKPMRDKLIYEQKGLHAMTTQVPWRDAGESLVVEVMHRAMQSRYGEIAAQPRLSERARQKKWSNEYKRVALALAGAKTPERVRHVICDLFARAGVNDKLQSDWRQLLPWLSDDRWTQTRDLALLGLASYRGKGVEKLEVSAPEATGDEN